MASKKQTSASKEIEDFTTELFDYIWTKHKFVSSSLDKKFTDKLSLIFDKPEKTSNFNYFIGNAVHCSQYLLREYCNHMFKKYQNDLIESDSLFCIGVFDVIFCWTNFRKNVFVKMIESAAIAAEAVLFCDADLMLPVELDRAAFTFKSFFTTFLQTEFFAKGGWTALKTKAIQDYLNLHLDLECYIRSTNHPYGKLNHFCNLIKLLRKSPMQFPLPVSMFCISCKESSENVIYAYSNKGKTFYRVLKDVFTRNSISNYKELLQNMDEVKNCISTALADDKAKFEFENELKNLTIDKTFPCFLLGKEQEDEQVKEAVAHMKHKKRTRKKKSSKPAEASTSTANTTDRS